VSKLRTGNAYVLKERDQRNVVVSMYVLNPHRVKPLKASDGSIFYELNTDELAGIPEDRMVVSDDDIMHDRMNCLFDSLVGMPPLYCASAPAQSSLAMQEFSSTFFVNAARPSGILTAPGEIPEREHERLKRQAEQGYSESNRGKVMVAGNGLKFEPMQQNAVDSQLIEQLKHTDESICAAFGIPAFMVGVKDPPNYNNAELLDLSYYNNVCEPDREYRRLFPKASPVNAGTALNLI
jgi:HK97 family phage portal protein